MKSVLRQSVLKQAPSMAVRAIQFESQRIFGKGFSKQKKLFNLDLHVSVIRDLQFGLANERTSLTNWSISRHNHIFRRFFKYPDPVRHINARNWKEIDAQSIRNFKKYYGKYLNQFDGFVVTHTPVFSDLFKSFDKPILIVNSTRYESPFTDDASKWESLNKSLIDGVKEGQFLIYSNNRGDSKYLEFFTGIKSEVVPSVCDYTGATWDRRGNLRVYFLSRQSDYVKKQLGTLKSWKSSEEVFGKKFSWMDFQTVSSVFVIPYNVSTMQLFEFSTAGIPVIVPTRRFLSELFFQGSALSEVSFYQVNNVDISSLSNIDPNNFSSSKFLEFWLDSADFYDSDLMPNIYFVDSFEELDSFKLPDKDSDLKNHVRKRNEKYTNLRKDALEEFVSRL